jgi:hypothetical protein
MKTYGGRGGIAPQSHSKSGCYKEKKHFSSVGNGTLAFQPLAHPYADGAIPTPYKL